jgi:hypothetical protein
MRQHNAHGMRRKARGWRISAVVVRLLHEAGGRRLSELQCCDCARRLSLAQGLTALIGGVRETWGEVTG